MNQSLQKLWYAMTSAPFDYRLQEQVSEFFSGKNILITGSSGFLGRQIIQMLVRDVPSLGSIIGIDLVAQNKADKSEIAFYKGYCADSELLNTIFKTHNIDIVIHCAAEKYLPELQNDSIKALKGNTLASIDFLYFCLEGQVRHILYISTDKATAPKSIYGASKRFPELYLSSLKQAYPKTNLSCIRLGNIFGSSGSVIEQWYDQLSKLGEISVRGQDMQRIFISPSQAALYCLLAIYLGHEMRYDRSEDSVESSDPGILRFGPTKHESWFIQDLARHWLDQRVDDYALNQSNSDLSGLIKSVPALKGEKTSELIWSDQDHPTQSNFKVLSYVCDFADEEQKILQAVKDLRLIIQDSIKNNSEGAVISRGTQYTITAHTALAAHETQTACLDWIRTNVPDFMP